MLKHYSSVGAAYSSEQCYLRDRKWHVFQGFLFVHNDRQYFFTQVCTYWHYVPCWEQDCGNGGYHASGDQSGKIHLRLYSGPLHPWRNHSAPYLFCIHPSKSISFSLGPYHTICHCFCHFLQVGFCASFGIIAWLCLAL